jgi:hypothetical protein
MWQFLRDLWRYTVTRAGNPLYQRELTGWAYTQFFAKLRRGCLPLFGLFFIGTASVCVLPTVVNIGGMQDLAQLLVVPYIVIFVFYISGEILLFIAGFLATALTATAISAEVEAQSYRLLRLTPFTPREIVLTKYSAAMYQMRLPLAINFLTRVGSVVAALAYTLIIGAAAALAGLSTNPSPLIPSSPPPTLGPIPFSFVFDSAAVLTTGAVLLAFLIMLFVLEPTLRLAMFAAIGLLASSLSKTRTNGLIAAIFVRGGYAVMAYIAAQSLQFLALPVVTFITLTPNLDTFFTTRPALAAALTLSGISFALALRLLFPIGVTAGTLLLTERRARRLPYNTA